MSAAPTELLIFVSPVYPGFHIGLCPHSTQGYAGVSCLKALAISLNFDAVASSGKGKTLMRISYLCVEVGIYESSSSILYYIFKEWKLVSHFCE